MNLDPVHHGQILIGRTSAHCQPTREIVRCGDAWQRIQSPKDVVNTARDPKNLLGRQGVSGRPFQFDSIGLHVNRFSEGVAEQ